MTSSLRFFLSVAVGLTWWLGVNSSQAQNFTVGNYQVVSSQRVGRTAFEYVIRVHITNNVGDAHGVMAQVFSASTNTIILQDRVGFGDVALGGSAPSTNAFKIRQNRTAPFNPGDLYWFPTVGSMALTLTVQTPVSGLLTNGTNVVVSGTVGAAVNGVLVGFKQVPLSGNAFTTIVPLEEGRNTISVVATNTFGGNTTTNIIVNRDTTPPILSIEDPIQGATLGMREITVTGSINDVVPGTVNPDQVTVMVNGIAAEVINRSYAKTNILLAPGKNMVAVVGRDRAGNQSQRQIEVTYQPPLSQKRLVKLAGENQTGMIGAVLPQPLVVELVDANGVVQTNQPVTFTVTRSDGIMLVEPDSGRALTVLTDDKGQAQAHYRLGSRNGVGNNQVSVIAAGVDAPVLFEANGVGATATKISALIPETQVGETTKPLPQPWIAYVTDAGGNPVADAPVTFTIFQGTGNMAGATNVVVNTDNDGRAAVFHTLGAEEGVNNNIVSATVAGVTNSSAVFLATALSPQQVSNTRVVGIVLDNANRPMTNVICRIIGTFLATVTDEQGQFIIPNAPVGAIRLWVDARDRGYPGKWHALQFDMVTVAGQDNQLDRPIYMLPLSSKQTAIAGGPQDVTLQMEGIAGSSLTIYANSLRDDSGQPITNEISWTQVNLERVPMAPPLGSQFTVAWAVQPAGLRFNPPARVCLPNTGLPAGQAVEMFSYDHDMRAFVSLGMGTVSADGSQICANPGFGITKSGWGGFVPPPPPPTCAGNCDDGNPCTSDSCVNGVCVHTPIANGARCDDSTGCSVRICQNGSCVTQTQQANGTPCDDGKFCTENDRCQDGACKGDAVEFPTTEVTRSYNISELINLVKNGLKPVETVTGCQFGDWSVSGSFGIALEKKCCEEQRIREAEGTKLKGSISVAVPELECPVPGFGASFLGGSVEVGLFVFVGGGGSISASGGKEACTQKNEFCVEGSVSMSLGGRAKALLGSDKILQIKVEGSTGGAVSVSCCNGKGEFKVVWNPLTVSGAATLAGFIETSVSWSLPPFPVLGPVEFTCPSAE